MMSNSVRVDAVLSGLFFLAAPGATAGLVPWLLTGWAYDGGLGWAQAGGIALATAGLAVVVAAFVQFVVEGRGTPAPTAPTETLVVGGLYRWVRNPMYVAVAAMIGGQALFFEDRGVAIWLAVFCAAVWTFTVAYEQPTLRASYGAQYATYCDNVPGWYPRLTPWRPEESR